MEQTIRISKSADVDVFVLGAGCAGVFAAISAAKLGARVLVAEKSAMPGGTLSVCGVDFPGIFHAWGKQIIGGSCYESLLRAERLGGAVIPEIVYRPERHWMMQVRLNVFTYVHVLEEMLAESGAQVLYHVMPCGIRETEDGVDVILAGKEGNLSVHAKVLIDATGDANAVARLGYPLLKSEVLQPATLINNLSGYEPGDWSESELNAVFEAALATGELAKRDLQGKRPAELLRDRRIHLHIHTASPETSAGKTDLEREARAAVFRVLQVFRRVRGLERIAVGSFCTECGVRESVRIDAETMITAADYLAGKVYDDAVCHAFYPIDLHIDHAIKQEFLSEGIVPTVPLSALIPKGAKHVLAPGRCLGSDTDANSALRVQAVCMATGQAAGAAAALAAAGAADGKAVDCRAVDYDALCAALCSLGAIVPQKRA